MLNMKRTVLCFLLWFPPLIWAPCQAQDFSGTWEGELNVQGNMLPFIIHFEKTDGAYTSVFDSPAQSAFGIPFDSTEVNGAEVKCVNVQGGIIYKASLGGGVLKGTFIQGVSTLPLELERKENGYSGPMRPQNPQDPFPYRIEEVEIANIKAGLFLRGTLTLPEGKGPFPAAVLITGSGPQNRDCEVAGHKPFLVLADHLTRNGIAVLRYDDRGTAASTGRFDSATTADFADDAEAVFEFLRAHADVNPDKTGLIGLSEGGLIGPIIAARNPDVGFVVMLAGPAVRGSELLAEQNEAIGRLSGFAPEFLREARMLNEKIYDYAVASPDVETMLAGAAEFAESTAREAGGKLAGAGPEEIESAVSEAANPWVRYFLGYDPEPTLAALKCPVLALYGGKDVQVPSSQNRPAAEAIFERERVDAELRVFPECNHLFQSAPTGAVSEYGMIEETMSPEVLSAIAEWIVDL